MMELIGLLFLMLCTPFVRKGNEIILEITPDCY